MAVADHQTLGDADPHEEIVRLEEHIEELAAKLESCRKFILASRVAVAGGALVRERDGKGDQRSRIGACSSDRTDQSRVSSHSGQVRRFAWGTVRRPGKM